MFDLLPEIKHRSDFTGFQPYLGPGIGFCFSTFYGAYVGDGLYRRVCSTLILSLSIDVNCSIVFCEEWGCREARNAHSSSDHR